jgi:raffinose/stachyose/melibiose transport system permease protein
MLTLAVLFFVWNWNDFLLPLVMLSGSDLQTAPMALVTFEGARRTDFAYLGAASIITIIPVVIVFILLQRSFTRGILAGSIKE